MTVFLKQSTASQSVIIGAFVDDTDFKTVETGLTIANTDIKLMKNGAASVNKNSGGATHRINGDYSITLDATDTNTVGELRVNVNVSGALVVWATYQVLEETVFDLYYGSGDTGEVVLQGVTHIGAVIPTVTAVTNQVTADVTSISGDTPAANNLEADYDGTGFAKAASTIGTCTTNTDMRGTDSALLAANINLASGVVESNLLQIGGVVQSATDLKDFADAGYDPATNKVEGVKLVDTTTANTDMRGTDSALLASSAPTNFGDLSITVTTGLVDQTQVSADKAWSTTARILTAATNITSDGSAINMSASGIIATVNVVNTTTVNTDMRGTDSALLAASAPTNFSDLAITVTTGLVSVGTNNDKTGYSISGTITTLDGLENISTSEVNAEMVDVMTVDTQALPGQAAPPLAPTFSEAITWMYKGYRNRTTQTATQWSLLADNETTVDAKATVSDDGTTAIKQEIVSGP